MKKDLMYKYTKTQLVNEHYCGVDLEQTKYYRINNIQKLNHLLAVGYELGLSVVMFEILDVDCAELTKALTILKKSGGYYAKVTKQNYTLLLILTNDYDYAVGIVDSISTDYLVTLFEDLRNEDCDLENVCFAVYQLAQHTLDKTSRKEKQFTASDLSEEEKLKQLVLVKKPTILRLEKSISLSG